MKSMPSEEWEIGSSSSSIPSHRWKIRPEFEENDMISPSGLSCGNFSSRITECPLRWHSIAAVRPPKPAPTMMTLIPDEDNLAYFVISTISCREALRRNLAEIDFILGNYCTHHRGLNVGFQYLLIETACLLTGTNRHDFADICLTGDSLSNCRIQVHTNDAFDVLRFGNPPRSILCTLRNYSKTILRYTDHTPHPLRHHLP
jgi:hypothetical protein